MELRRYIGSLSGTRGEKGEAEGKREICTLVDIVVRVGGHDEIRTEMCARLEV